MFFKSCNCNSSIATRVGFAVSSLCFLCGTLAKFITQIIFSLNSILAWVMKTDAAIKLIQKWSFDYIKMECAGEKCYGILAVSTEYHLLKCKLQFSSLLGPSNLFCVGALPFAP